MKLTDNQLTQLYLEVLRFNARERLSKAELETQLKRKLDDLVAHPKPEGLHLGIDNIVQAKAVVSTVVQALPDPQIFDRNKAVFRWKGYNKSQSTGLTTSKIAYLALIIVLSVLTLGAVLALYAMFSEFLNSMERFIYNEGWLRASISLASMLAGTLAGGTVAVFLGAVPLILLAFGLGVANPLAFVIAGIVCISILGSALVNGVANWLQTKAVEKSHESAIDPADPYRFQLTDKEEKNLKSKELDPLKVKCAIVALREKIGDSTPSFLHRMFVDHEKQRLLSLVRQLRRGKILDKVEVGEMIFDLRRKNPEGELENTPPDTVGGALGLTV